MAKKALPPEVLACFRQQGAKGGRIGGPRSLETMTAAERRARAKKAGLAGVAARRAKAQASRPARRPPVADPTLKRDLQAIVRRAAARPIVDTRPADVILGYDDDDGLPS